MPTKRLTKLVAKNFMFFKDLEIKEAKCTLINCRFVDNDGIEAFINVCDFLFIDKDFPIDDIKYFDQQPDREESTFVEAHVQLANGESKIIRKSLNQHTVTYTVGNVETSRQDFIKNLRELQLFFSYANVLHPVILRKLSNLNDDNRSTLIDMVCNNDASRRTYRSLKTQIDECQILLKHRNDLLKQYIAYKKNEKQKVEKEVKVSAAYKDLEHKQKQHTLLKIHLAGETMKKVIEDTDSNMLRCTNMLQEYKDNLEQLQFDNERLNEKLKGSFSREIEYEMLRTDRIFKERITNLLIQKKGQCLAADKQKEFIEKAQERIESIKQAQKLLKTHRKNGKTISDAFYRTQKKILYEHPDYVCYLSCRKIRDRLDVYRDNGNKSMQAMNDRKALIKKKQLENQQMIKLKKDEFEKLTVACLEQKEEAEATSRVLEAYERIIAADRLMFEPDIRQIEFFLKQRFANEIVGILSELFDVVETDELPLLRNGIVELLGEKGDSIIVYSSETMEKCIEYLSSMKTASFEVNLVPMDKYENVVISTSKPADVRGMEIEYCLKPKYPAIRSILMEFLQPMIIVDGEELSVFEAVGKKVQVANFGSSTMFTEDGIRIFSNLEMNYKNKDVPKILETLNELREKESDAFLKNSMMRGILSEISEERTDLNGQKALLESLLVTIEEEIALKTKNFDEFDSLCAEMEEKFRGIIEESFAELLSKSNCSTFDELETEASNFAAFDDKMLTLTKMKKTYEKMIQRFASASPEEIHAQVENIQKEIEEAKAKEKEFLLHSNADEDIATVIQAKKKFKEMEEDFANIIGDQYRNAHKLSSAMQDLYTKLDDRLTFFDDIPQLEVLRVPWIEDLSPDDDPVIDQLSQLKVDTDDIDEELLDAENVDLKALELEYELKALRDALDKFPVLIEGDTDRIKTINKKMKDLEAKINKTSKNHEEFSETFKNTQLARIERFNKCLQVINEEVAKFCQIAFKGEVSGEIKPVDEVEPYLNKLQYFWRTASGEECLSESSQNYYAALALFLGILKFKNQRFINFVDNTDNLKVRDALKAFSESEETDFQCNILCLNYVVDDDCACCFMPRDNQIEVENRDDSEEFYQTEL